MRTELEEAAIEFAMADRDWRRVVQMWQGPWEDAPREYREAIRASDARRAAAQFRLCKLGEALLAAMERAA